ncbi:glutamate decarboxylase 2-like [Scleropages formosus]|uniref:Glutamate decarboxylase 2 n=1 Tax=Scleropages formosus TaxID=113540 RepID=A0A0P7UCH9_SCLFO|nr:glutamate decarboxylase 2-like [Scleropages formosus]
MGKAAQRFTGDIGSKLYALLSTGDEEDKISAQRRGKSAGDPSGGCSTAHLDFSFLYSTDLLPMTDGDLATMTFLQDVVDIMLGYIVKSFDRSTKVIDFQYPNELLQMNNWELSDEPETLDDVLVNCRATLEYAVKTGEVRSMSTTGETCVCVLLLTYSDVTFISDPRFTYEVAPVFVLLEYVTLKKMREIIGWQDGHGDGIFSPGSHFSIKKGAAALGIGTESVICVKVDERRGLVPFFVSATAGTTVYGAFDPLIAIADICRKHGVWMHVDGLMQKCNQMQASYLFQEDKQYDVSYDTGDKAIQCGRHVDIFKLWLMWRAKGTVGFEAQIDKCLELSEYLYDKIKDREGYEMVFNGKPQHTNVCFWYLPPAIRCMEDGEERRRRLHKVAPIIKARMMEYGTTMVSYQPQGNKVNFFRMVISNPAATFEDINFLIEEIERLGQDL